LAARLEEGSLKKMIESNGNDRRRDSGHGGGRSTFEGHSGRRFLILAGVGLLVLSGMLFLLFRDWRIRYRERAEYGLNQVVPTIDELYYLELNNKHISDDDWRDAVDRTHAMLETVVTANLLDYIQLKALRAELETRVTQAKAHPETAPAELAAIWDDMTDRAEFLLAEKDRHPRPKILRERIAKQLNK